MHLDAQPGPQTDFLLSDADVVFYGGAAGGGKAARLDEPVPTPSGWSTMGDLRVGDMVFNEHGQPIRVLQTHPVIERPESFRVTFACGSTIDVCAEHLWLTFDAREREALRRRDPEFRSRRRASRPRRGNPATSSARQEFMEGHNRDIGADARKPPPCGTVRTTKDVLASLRTGSGRLNHAIPVAGPLDLPERELSIAPYLLGVWLGDGTSTSSEFTSADPEIAEHIRSLGYEVRKLKAPLLWSVPTLITSLRALGLRSNKHIPIEYLRASHAQRLELLRGLMDTDGYADVDGRTEFTTTSEQLRDGFIELVASLGFRASAGEGRATLNGVDHGPKYRFRVIANEQIFRLRRKAERFNPHRHRFTFNFITDVQPIAAVPMRCITVDNPTGLFLVGRRHLVTHNSWALLLDALTRALATPGWTGLVIRRLRESMKIKGGIWHEALRLFADSGAEFNHSELSITWPNGSSLTFRQALHNPGLFAGPSYDWIALEEMQEMDIDVLILSLTRLRSTKGLHPVVRCTMNPKRGHKVVKWLAWYLLGDGEPDRSKSGIVRWFCRRSDTDAFAFGATASEAEANAVEPAGRALSYAFIPSLLEDNPALDQADHDYRNRIKMQGRMRAAQLGRGNWYVGGDDDGPLARDRWAHVVAPLSPIVRYVRAWDKAATRPSDAHKDPDFTIGIKFGFDAAGRFYIVDMVACREDVDRRDSLIAATAKADGHMCQQVHKQGPGDAGKSDVHHTRPLLAQAGGLAPVHVREAKDKLVRATPLIRALELGMRNGAPVSPDNPASETEWEPRGFVLDAEVRDEFGQLVPGSSWLLRPYKDAGSHPETIGELLWEHLDPFPGGDHDDAADAGADAFEVGTAAPGRQVPAETRGARYARRGR